MTTKDLSIGMRVLYVPWYVAGDKNNAHCRRARVTSWQASKSDKFCFVFLRYGTKKKPHIVTIDELERL